ncbi:unnamed protein product [Moneuplotes crassus]|uniref:Uncharacterized protein n=1 Tax=Euplotes crassus TaxID=5936 RepID=A0AAD1U701_EUPCR|nr:unnamed protein product [Moneuplotes crassus]
MEVRVNKNTKKLCLSQLSKPHFNLSKSLQREILAKLAPDKNKRFQVSNKMAPQFMQKYSLAQLPSRTICREEINDDIKDMINHNSESQKPKRSFLPKRTHKVLASHTHWPLVEANEAAMPDRKNDLKTPEFPILSDQIQSRRNFNSRKGIRKIGTIAEENLSNILSVNYEYSTPDKYMSPKFGSPSNHNLMDSQTSDNNNMLHIHLQNEIDGNNHEVSFDGKDIPPAELEENALQNESSNTDRIKGIIEFRKKEKSSEKRKRFSRELTSTTSNIASLNITQLKRTGGTNILHSFRNPGLPFKKFRIRKSNITNIDHNDPEIDNILNSNSSNTRFPQLDKYKEVVRKCLADPDYLLSKEYLQNELHEKPIPSVHKSQSTGKIEPKSSYFEKQEWREQIRNLNCITSLNMTKKVAKKIVQKRRALSIENPKSRVNKNLEKEAASPPSLRPKYKKKAVKNVLMKQPQPSERATRKVAKTLKIDSKNSSGACLYKDKLKNK